MHYGRTTDSSSIEVNHLQQIKGEWRSHRPLPQSSATHDAKKTHLFCRLSKDYYDMDGKGHVIVCIYRPGFKRSGCRVCVSHLTMSMA